MGAADATTAAIARTDKVLSFIAAEKNTEVFDWHTPLRYVFATMIALGGVANGKNRVGESCDWHYHSQMNDYERIARVIRFLDERRLDQPCLEAIAAEVGLSPSHVHRMFSAWAGVTPKDFLQCLTADHSRRLLRSGRPALVAAIESGLSGPGRLHDLCVGLEAATPGEIKSGGAGMRIQLGVSESPFGTCLVGESDRGICHLSFCETEKVDNEIIAARSNWPVAKWIRDDKRAARIVGRIFRKPDLPDLGLPRLRAWVQGTAFQVRVWRALLQVEPGQVVSYGQLAAAIGQPTASRAVGTAVGNNAISWLIPCHRVIRETGVIGNYRWGSERKRAMLVWEQGRRIDAGGKRGPFKS